MKDVPITISDLSKKAQTKVIKIYNKAFVDQPTPCPTCKQSCCAWCNTGYLSEKQFQEAKKKYKWTPVDIKTTYEPAHQLGRYHGTIDHGFFVAGEGCSIPVKERSQVCISYTCGKMNTGQREAGAKIRDLFNHG